MKKLILTAVLSFLAGVLATFLVAYGVAYKYLNLGGDSDMKVEISTDGVYWDTPANKESVVILYNSLPQQVRDMCRREYVRKVADGASKVTLTYPEGELHFDMDAKRFNICSEGVNVTVEGCDKAFFDELFLDNKQ